MCNALDHQRPDLGSHIPEPVGRHGLEDVVHGGLQAGHLRVAALYDLLEGGHALLAGLHTTQLWVGIKFTVWGGEELAYILA